MKKNSSIAELINEARSFDTGRLRAAGKLMSVSERSPTESVSLLTALSEVPFPRIMLGITGAPGSGKSVLTERFISTVRERNPNTKVGVIAVDPSSPFSGGSLLGDRIRMMKHATDPNVFIRSVATRGQLGGVTLGTLGILRVMGLLGCDIVLVETVGVGQMEFSIREVTDIVAVILAPGQGDTIQFLKAGLMEVGDMFVVNKADRPDAAQFYAQLTHALRLSEKNRRHIDEGSVFLVSARDNTGIVSFIDSVERVQMNKCELWETERQKRLEGLIRRVILSECLLLIEAEFDKISEDSIKKILSGKAEVSGAVEELIRYVL